MRTKTKPKLKAYKCYLYDAPYADGCLLVFASNRNAARNCAVNEGDWFTLYPEMAALRCPDFDEYATGSRAYAVESNKDLPAGVKFYDMAALWAMFSIRARGIEV